MRSESTHLSRSMHLRNQIELGAFERSARLYAECSVGETPTLRGEYSVVLQLMFHLYNHCPRKESLFGEIVAGDTEDEFAVAYSKL